MAVQSSGEFEIIMNNIVMRLDRRLSEQPNNTLLVRSKGVMTESIQWARQGKKITPAQLKSFTDACDQIRDSFRSDTPLSDKLFDLLDFLEYRLG
ncbi:hypothetical protein [Chondromyces crocatus]|uniref:Uncharacterized protein n=1 Tax=Chondromyces crocatus TaxID=52 RepID=A0A0K1EB09_CHOCO|nr:hypothetical protein [Chondromyces crocatus]AKT37872.1 uncharacterized protein CMC5_020150 [Chondromyces crocatus]